MPQRHIRVALSCWFECSRTHKATPPPASLATLEKPSDKKTKVPSKRYRLGNTKLNVQQILDKAVDKPECPEVTSTVVPPATESKAQLASVIFPEAKKAKTSIKSFFAAKPAQLALTACANELEFMPPALD